MNELELVRQQAIENWEAMPFADGRWDAALCAMDKAINSEGMARREIRYAQRLAADDADAQALAEEVATLTEPD